MRATFKYVIEVTHNTFQQLHFDHFIELRYNQLCPIAIEQVVVIFMITIELNDPISPIELW